jgi:hypothetical protein
MPFNDLKFYRRTSNLRTAMCGGLNYEHRQTRFLSGNGASSAPCLLSMRRSLQRQLQGQGVYLPRPVSLYGIRPIDLSREPAGHRSLPTGTEGQALSHVDSLFSVSQLTSAPGATLLPFQKVPMNTQFENSQPSPTDENNIILRTRKCRLDCIGRN